MKKVNVLITGAGAPGGPGIIKGVQAAGHKVWGGDADNQASGRFLADSFVRLPPASDEGFIPFVLEYCLAHGIEIIFPLVTKELSRFAAAKSAFRDQGIRVIVSEGEQLGIAIDKGRLYDHLYTYNIVVPQYQIVNGVDDLITAAKNLGYPARPVCVKPTVANGSRGVRVLQESIDAYDLLFHHKPNHLFTSLDGFCQVINGKPFPQLLVAEYLPGPEFTIDAIVSNGEVKLLLPRSREKMNNGISVRGTFIQHKEIMAYCLQILQSLYLHGPIGLQVKEAADGTFKLLEINPRIQGTSTAAQGLGINLPALVVQQEFTPIAVDTTKIKWGTSFVRYYEELFY